MEYYEVEIARTCKGLFSKEGFRHFDHVTKSFKSEKEAREWLDNDYYRPCKRVKMYVDGVNGEAIQIGWIFCFTSKEDGETFNQQDWVELKKVNKQAEPIIF